LPKAQWLLGDGGHDADRFGDALQAKGIQPCIPGRRSRDEPVGYTSALTVPAMPRRGRTVPTWSPALGHRTHWQQKSESTESCKRSMRASCQQV
jgi:hypothetical protein